MAYTFTPSHDLIENPSPRCACMVVLDTSGSMNGAAIEQLNEGFQFFINALKEDEIAAYSVEVGVITAGESVIEQLPFTAAYNIEHVKCFRASGLTPLGKATELALRRLEERKKEYKKNGVAYYQPWLVIISDGVPTDLYEHVANKARDLSQNRKLVCLPVGVNGANLSILSQFTHRGAKKLDGLKFNEFFDWLSTSMSRVSSSASTCSSIQLPSTDGWDSI